MARPPPPLVYYLDANLDSPEIASGLRAGGMTCERHREHFAQDAEDEIWIPPIAERGWVIVTRDLAIQRRPLERAAWMSAKAILLMLRGNKLTGDDIVRVLVARFASGLDAFIARRSPPDGSPPAAGRRTQRGVRRRAPRGPTKVAALPGDGLGPTPTRWPPYGNHRTGTVDIGAAYRLDLYRKETPGRRLRTDLVTT